MFNFKRVLPKFALFVILGAIILLAVGLLRRPTNNSLPRFITQLAKNSTSEIISGYPHQCQKRMGFDNWRTFNALAVDPQDSQTLYVAVEYKGVYKSQDGGQTWVAKNQGIRGYPDQDNPQLPCPEQHPSLIIDKKDSQRLLMTSASSPGKLTDMNSESGGLYETTDGGETWHQLFSDNMSAWTYEALAIDPTDSETIYVGTTAMAASYDEADPNIIFVNEGIIYKTTNSGKKWQELKTGLVPDLRAGKIFINPENASHLIFTTMALPANKGGGQVKNDQLGILESKDGGESWTQLTSLPQSARAVAEADLAPTNFNHMFMTARLADGNEDKYYSLDGGKSFNQVRTTVNLFRYDPHDTQGLRLLGLNIFTSSRSLFESLDGGKTWTAYGSLPKEVSNDLRVSNIVWDPSNANTVYLNGDQANIWKSTDKGRTWVNILNLEKLP